MGLGFRTQFLVGIRSMLGSIPETYGWEINGLDRFINLNGLLKNSHQFQHGKGKKYKMALAWFICGFNFVEGHNGPNSRRVCAMDNFSPSIFADGGAWSESEVLGGFAVVKVRASVATLTIIGGTAGFTRIPNNWVDLSTTLGSLTTGQRTTLLNLITSMGYTTAEINAALGSNLTGWRTKTLGQVLRFIAQRRLKSRWDNVQHQIVLDGILQSCKPIDDINAEVQ